MRTVTTKKREANNEDAPQECDRSPVIPTNIISDLILPFLRDRTTWNSVCSANKELYKAGMGMTPPWPQGKFKLGQDRQDQDYGPRSLKFSPCGAFLASSVSNSTSDDTSWTPPNAVAICDRRGRITRLIGGHTSHIYHLSFSKDGKYLASAGADKSIRIWPTNSTGLPQQSDKTLGHRGIIACLDFAPDDSNILVCRDSHDIKVWDVEAEVCTHQFDYNGRRWPSQYFQSMCLPPARDKLRTCFFVTSIGQLIRTSWDDLSGIASEIVDMLCPGQGYTGLGRVRGSTFSQCGSLLAVSSTDEGHGGDSGNTVDIILYDMKLMSVLQSVTIVDCTPGDDHNLVFLPDGKTLVFDGGYSEEIMVFQVHDLNIMRRLEEDDADAPRRTSAIASNPNGHVLASAGLGSNYVRLWTL